MTTNNTNVKVTNTEVQEVVNGVIYNPAKKIMDVGVTIGVKVDDTCAMQLFAQSTHVDLLNVDLSKVTKLPVMSGQALLNAGAFDSLQEKASVGKAGIHGAKLYLQSFISKVLDEATNKDCEVIGTLNIAMSGSFPNLWNNGLKELKRRETTYSSLSEYIVGAYQDDAYSALELEGLVRKIMSHKAVKNLAINFSQLTKQSLIANFKKQIAIATYNIANHGLDLNGAEVEQVPEVYRVYDGQGNVIFEESSEEFMKDVNSRRNGSNNNNSAGADERAKRLAEKKRQRQERLASYNARRA